MFDDFAGHRFWPALREWVANAGIEPISDGEQEPEIWEKIRLASAAVGSPLSLGLTPSEMIREVSALVAGAGGGQQYTTGIAMNRAQPGTSKSGSAVSVPFTSLRHHYASSDGDVDNIQCVDLGWYAVAGTGLTALGNDYTFKRYLEYPVGSGVFHQFTWAGNPLCTVPNDGLMKSDVLLSSVTGLPLVIAAGTMAHERTVITVSSFVPQIDQPFGSVTLGIPDGNFAGDRGNTSTVSPSTSTGRYGCAALLGRIAKANARSWVLIGDSISSLGTSDNSVGPKGGSGWTARLMDRYGLPYVKVGSGGMTIANVAATVSRLRTFMAALGFTDALMQMGINDHTGGRSEAQMLADFATVMNIAEFSTKTRHQSTITPRTDSSDSWATSANQTVKTDGTMALLPTTNDNIRARQSWNNGQIFEVADIAMTARNSGIWPAPPQPCPDGTHPTAYMANLIQAGLTIT